MSGQPTCPKCGWKSDGFSTDHDCRQESSLAPAPGSEAASVESAEDRFWSYLKFNAENGFRAALGHREVEWVLAARDRWLRLRGKINLIQQIQFEDMPEPWRTRVCDVIANGADRGAGILLGECTIDTATGEIIEPQNSPTVPPSGRDE